MSFRLRTIRPWGRSLILSAAAGVLSLRSRNVIKGTVDSELEDLPKIWHDSRGVTKPRLEESTVANGMWGHLSKNNYSRFHIDGLKHKFYTYMWTLGGLQTFASREPGTMVKRARYETTLLFPRRTARRRSETSEQGLIKGG